MTQPQLTFTDSRASQSEAMLRDLKCGAVLDCMSILQAYNCNSGKQRIFDLRERGWNIKGEWVELPNKKRIKRWHLDLAQPFIARNGNAKPKKFSLEKIKQIAKDEAKSLEEQLLFSRLIVRLER